MIENVSSIITSLLPSFSNIIQSFHDFYWSKAETPSDPEFLAASAPTATQFW
jgi:hypothetical protein